MYSFNKGWDNELKWTLIHYKAKSKVIYLCLDI